MKQRLCERWQTPISVPQNNKCHRNASKFVLPAINAGEYARESVKGHLCPVDRE